MTEETAPKPMVTRAAEAVVAAPAAVRDWFTTLSPAINACIIAIVTAAVTLGSTLLTQHLVKQSGPTFKTLQAADAPKAEPAPMRVVVEPLDGIKAELASMRSECGGKIEEVLRRLPEPKAPPAKATKTKTAGTR